MEIPHLNRTCSARIFFSTRFICNYFSLIDFLVFYENLFLNINKAPRLDFKFSLFGIVKLLINAKSLSLKIEFFIFNLIRLVFFQCIFFISLIDSFKNHPIFVNLDELVFNRFNISGFDIVFHKLIEDNFCVKISLVIFSYLNFYSVINRMVLKGNFQKPQHLT